MPETVHVFTVLGRTSFPVDMLRYDACRPWSESDSSQIMASLERVQGVREPRQVTLTGSREPTEGRWESFGWKVI
jgi:hypothetical protein